MPAKGQASPLKKGLVGDQSDPKGFAVMTESYLEWMREKNYSPATISSRDAYLRYFVQWCDDRSLTRLNEDHQTDLGTLSKIPVHLPKRKTASR